MSKLKKREFFEITEKWLEQEFAALDEHRELVCLPFEDDTPEKQARRIKRAKRDKFYFVRTYFPHYARLQGCRMHREMLKMADMPGASLFIAFRGGSKTSIITKLDTIHAVVFETAKYILLGALTLDLSSKFLYSVRREFEKNARLKNDFGTLVGSRYWSKETIETANGCRVETISYNTQSRGFNFGAFRPDLIKLDDITSREIERNPERINDVMQWITQDIYPALTKNGRMHVMGTPIESNGVIERLANDPEKRESWNICRYPAITEKNGKQKSAWPGKYTLADLEKKKREIGTYAFAAEFMLTPIKGNKFQQQWFRYIDESDLPDENALIKVCWIDPALGKPDGCDVAIITIAKHRAKKQIYILSAHIGAYSLEQAREIFEGEYLKHQPIRMAGESNGMQAIYTEQLNSRLAMPYDNYDTKGNKRLRIESLSSLFERGDIVFVNPLTPGMKKLQQQLIYYPRVNMDGPDALERAIYVSNQQTIDFLGLVPS